AENLGEQFLRHLCQPLGPARLLHLKAVHFNRQLRRAIEPRQIYKSPAFQLRAVAEVGIFRERIRLPATGLINHAPPQNSRRAVEVEEIAGARAGPVLEDKMPVE